MEDIASVIESVPVQALGRAEAKALEKEILTGLRTWHADSMDLGEKLKRFRDLRAWHTLGYTSFSAWCSGAGEITKGYASKLLSAIEQADAIGVSARKLDVTAHQLQPLGALSDDALKKAAWEKAMSAAEEGGKSSPSAAQVRAAVEEVKAEPKPDEEEENEEAEPSRPWDEWNEKVRAVMSELRSISRKMNDLFEADGKARRLDAKWAHFMSHQGTIGAVNSIVRSLADNGLIAEECDEAPGYIPARVKDARDSVNAGST